MFAANRARIAQSVRHLIEHRVNVFFRFLFRRAGFQFHQQAQGVGGARPGAEVFGRELVAHRFVQVRVHHAGVEAVALARRVEILK